MSNQYSRDPSVREPSVNSHSKSSRGSSTNKIPAEIVKVEPITKHSWFEEMNYKFNVLVPINEEKELSVPIDSYLQQVHIGDHAKWRVVRNHDYNLPPYLTDHKEQETVYRVKTTEKKYWQPLELGSPFLKKWDQLALTLLLFTASVTPFETA
ncbi:hypothetical protein HDU91_003728 [Kappamyces sp. JEL0680]|nr:hypothetical protein HDU91_003728 [Kappamyces sp. JEL0680]